MDRMFLALLMHQLLACFSYKFSYSKIIENKTKVFRVNWETQSPNEYNSKVYVIFKIQNSSSPTNGSAPHHNSED